MKIKIMLLHVALFTLTHSIYSMQTIDDDKLPLLFSNQEDKPTLLIKNNNQKLEINDKWLYFPAKEPFELFKLVAKDRYTAKSVIKNSYQTINTTSFCCCTFIKINYKESAYKQKLKEALEKLQKLLKDKNKYGIKTKTTFKLTGGFLTAKDPQIFEQIAEIAQDWTLESQVTKEAVNSAIEKIEAPPWTRLFDSY